MFKNKALLSILLVGIGVLAGLFVPIETHPSPNTRVVLEHTYKTYIVPVCFEESDATNFLGESTLKEAKRLNYAPHSPCTEEALASETDRLFISLLKKLGFLET